MPKGKLPPKEEQLSLGVAVPHAEARAPQLPESPANTRKPADWIDAEKAERVYVPMLDRWAPGRLLMLGKHHVEPRGAQALVELEGGGRVEVRTLNQLRIPEKRRES